MNSRCDSLRNSAIRQIENGKAELAESIRLMGLMSAKGELIEALEMNKALSEEVAQSEIEQALALIESSIQQIAARRCAPDVAMVREEVSDGNNGSR